MSDLNNDFDLTFLYEIADGSNDFIIESITMFLDQSPEILNELGNAINSGNWADAAQAAHKIKANLGFFGMLNSQAIIQQIETACKQEVPDIADLKAKYSEVKSIIDANLIALRQIKAGKENGI
jgi:HPt (histidine-containing phosphotransfer) domain-containing protein